MIKRTFRKTANPGTFVLVNKSEIAKVQTLVPAKLTLEAPVTKIVEFSDCVDTEEVAASS